MANETKIEFAAKLGERLAEAMFHKCGVDLSAPINFCCSRPWYRYMEGHNLDKAERSAFTTSYKHTWWMLKTHGSKA